MNVHISGANGFLGQALIHALSSKSVSTVPWVRHRSGLINEVLITDYHNTEIITETLRTCDVFVHLAAKVHQIKVANDDFDNDYKFVNHDLTLVLAKACLKAGVKHFIYLSSIKAVCENSNCPLDETCVSNPSDHYGRSKLMAEEGLMQLSRNSGLIVTIIRPPLVYGPGVRANFRNLLSWLYWSLPVPFKLINNKRSFIYVGNLVSAIYQAISNSPTKSGIYFLSDGHDLSSHELCVKLAKHLNKPLSSIPISATFLNKTGIILGKKEQMSRLLGSLQINSALFCSKFEWQPPYTVDDGLKITANWFLWDKRQKKQFLIKRLFDVFFSTIAGVYLFLPILIVGLLVKLTSKGPVLYWSKRVGVNNELFEMPKFRSMRIDTPVVATHLLSNPDLYLTPVGKFLRHSSLDELPQLFCVFRGQMSLVGPRPALFNQFDLIALRTKTKVHQLVPGITGWAQVNGRDELDLNLKVMYDQEYMERRNLFFDIKILSMTLFKVLARKNISH